MNNEVSNRRKTCRGSIPRDTEQASKSLRIPSHSEGHPGPSADAHLAKSDMYILYDHVHIICSIWITQIDSITNCRAIHMILLIDDHHFYLEIPVTHRSLTPCLKTAPSVSPLRLKSPRSSICSSTRASTTPSSQHSSARISTISNTLNTC